MTTTRTQAELGFQVRTEVLGAAYVSASAASSDPFTEPLQEFLNANCWGLVWARDGLDRKTRSIVTLTALAASNKWREFATHVLGALRNGWTPQELREAILHMSVYLGVPTALEAFRAASPVVAGFEP